MDLAGHVGAEELGGSGEITAVGRDESSGVTFEDIRASMIDFRF